MILSLDFESWTFEHTWEISQTLSTAWEVVNIYYKQTQGKEGGGQI